MQHFNQLQHRQFYFHILRNYGDESMNLEKQKGAGDKEELTSSFQRLNRSFMPLSNFIPVKA